MGTFLSCFLHVLLLTCAPTLAFALALFFCRALFVYLVGEDRRRLLLVALAPSTPLRELGHAFFAVLFCHRVTDARFLDLHSPDGEIGYVEHSYNPRNPVAILGNFFYILGPLVVGLFAVYTVFWLCFGHVMVDFRAALAAIAEEGGGFAAYLGATLTLPAARFRADVAIPLKILGFVLLLFLCMGLFVSFSDLVDALSGFALFALLAAVFAAVLSLFDARLRGAVLGGLRAFAVYVTSLWLAVFLAVAVWLAVGLLVFLYRVLFGTRNPPAETGLREYDAPEERGYPDDRG